MAGPAAPGHPESLGLSIPLGSCVRISDRCGSERPFDFQTAVSVRLGLNAFAAAEFVVPAAPGSVEPLLSFVDVVVRRQSRGRWLPVSGERSLLKEQKHVMAKRLLYFAAVAAVALAMACSDSKKTEVAPAGPTPVETDAHADGSTLKVSAPVPTSPANGATLAIESMGTDNRVTLRIAASTGTYVPAGTLTYYYQLLDASGNLVRSQTTTASSIVLTGLELNTTYRWKVRAESGANVGPSSATWSFVTPDVPTGYIRGNELYDPLTDGKTVGTIHGPVTFIPGVGARLETFDSYIDYPLPVTLSDGEYSALVTNLSTHGSDEDPKTRVMTMRQGTGQINDNLYRMSLDKRNNGVIAWRFLTGSGSDFISSGPSERKRYSFHEDLTYFWRGEWGGGRFVVTVREGGVSGKTIYSVSKAYHRSYKPSPHMIQAGDPHAPGDRGSASTVPGMIIRQIWVSPNPRPGFANK